MVTIFKKNGSNPTGTVDMTFLTALSMMDTVLSTELATAVNLPPSDTATPIGSVPTGIVAITLW